MSYAECRLFLCVGVGLCLVWAALRLVPAPCRPEDSPRTAYQQVPTLVREGRVYAYSRDMPLIFIGGAPRSGATLMRVMLDAHPDVRCGPDSHVIPLILEMKSRWLRSRERVTLEEAGLSKEVINSAIAAFALEIITRHGDPAPRLCDKDPLTLKSASYLAELFPRARFIFMVRDGRATVHSIMSRQAAVPGFSLGSYRRCLEDWNKAVGRMHAQCREVGAGRCLVVPYEQLVLRPRGWMERILGFLDVPWDESVLHHEEHVNKPGGVVVPRSEESMDQVIKPVSSDALTKWVGHIPRDVVRDMAQIAPMLSVLGYDPHDNFPRYGTPDAAVAGNTSSVRGRDKPTRSEDDAD
ncbi:protein-tyrosine sulfotransferase-like [Bacillus rossius redtenbacheri]|uniref:protein-tyrosine sulfotransferase-like n=1 Tax=Bacillus rossius redtenbacheri TaxID=93214 RepID=UPI002FDCEE69